MPATETRIFLHHPIGKGPGMEQQGRVGEKIDKAHFPQSALGRAQ